MFNHHHHFSLKGLFAMAVKSTQELLAEIETFHTEADIETDVTKKVTDSVSAAIPGIVNEAVTAATADLTQKVTDNQTVLQAIVDKLAAGDANAANEIATAALAPSDNGATKAADDKGADAGQATS